MAEAAFHHLAFFLASPGTPLPRNPQERTAFRVPVRTSLALDLTAPPLACDRTAWTHPTDYASCQDLADRAREARIEVLRYESVRDPEGGANLALLSPAVLAATWRVLLRRDRVDAVREMPRAALSFALSGWAARNPRIPPRVGGGTGAWTP